MPQSQNEFLPDDELVPSWKSRTSSVEPEFEKINRNDFIRTKKSTKKPECGAERLVFFGRASNRHPGRYASDYDWVANIFDSKWDTLKRIQNWRWVLSSTFENPFQIDGLTFLTAEHYERYAEASVSGSAKAYLYSLESNSQFSSSKDFIASNYRGAKQELLVKLTDDEEEEWRKHVKPSAQEKLLLHKFAKGRIEREVLLATYNAQLWCLVPKKPKFRRTRTSRTRTHRSRTRSRTRSCTRTCRRKTSRRSRVRHSVPHSSKSSLRAKRMFKHEELRDRIREEPILLKKRSKNTIKT